jgi:hypothetical protein
MSSIIPIPRAYQPFIASGALIVAALAGLFIGVVPISLRAVDLFRQLGPLREEVAGLTQKDSALSGLGQEELEEKLATLLTAVPQDKSVASLFSLTEGIAGRSGVAITDMGVSSPGSIATAAATKQTTQEKELGSGLVPFNLAIEGTLPQIREFLRVSASSRRLSRVRSFEISFRSDGSAKATVVMDAFWAPFPAAIGKVSQRITPLTTQQEELIGDMAQLELLSESPVVSSVVVTIPESAEKDDPFAP